MEKVVRFDESLDIFKNIVLLYKDENENTYLGSTISNEEVGHEAKNYIVLYKDALPKDSDYIAGWNYLDDHSSKKYLVYNDLLSVAVDDFLAAHNVDKTWKDVAYETVDSSMDMNQKLAKLSLEPNQVYAIATLK